LTIKLTGALYADAMKETETAYHRRQAVALSTRPVE